MNPTANKSDFDDLTTNLKDLAYSYLEKYSPSKQQLKVFLLKKYLTKIKGTKSKKEVSIIIDEIVMNLEKNRIWVYQINMLGIGAPTFFPMEQSVYVLSDIRKVSSHNLLKNLITLEIFNEHSHRIVKCFVKKGEYKRFRELIDRKKSPQ